MIIQDIQPRTGLDKMFYHSMAELDRLLKPRVTKIEVQEYQEPEIGELRINFFVDEAIAEDDGEIITVEKWDGTGWLQFNLSAYDTVQDLLDLEEKLGE